MNTDLNRVATQAARDAGLALGATPSREQADAVAAIIARAMQTAVHEAGRAHANAGADCARHDADLAHKIRAEIERKKVALIANLSSMR